MIEEIKSTRVRKVNNALNHGNIKEDELNLMAEFEDAELAEFLFLIEQGIISHNILAYYFVVYNKSRMKTIEKAYKYEFINGLLASAWTDSYQNQDADTMVDMLLGLSFINTDLLARIRSGLKLNSKKLNAFDIKVEEILKVLMERAENGTLYRALTSVDHPDHSALSDDDNILFLNIKEDLDNISNVFEIYEINHGNFKNKEYLSKDPKKLAKYEEDLRTEIKAYFNLDELNRRFSYLPEYYKEVILGALTGNNNVKKTEDKLFGKTPKSGKVKDKKEKDLLDSLSTVERDEIELEPVLNTGEDKVFGAFERIVNTKKKERVSDSNDKTIGVHDILVGLEEKRTSSNFSVLFKIVIALLAVMALIGWGLSVRSNNTDGSDHVKDLTYQEILSYKISSGENAKYDMKINRSTTNTGDIGNGAVKESIPMLSNILIGENITYAFIVSIIIFITAISLMVAVFKFLFLAKEHYYSAKFLKVFNNSNDLEDVLENASDMKSRSILATAYFYGFKEFYSVYKLNPNYQSGSSIALSTRTMEMAISRKIEKANGYSFMLYLSFILPGLAICAIIFNYSNYIEIYKSFDKIDPKILVDSLRLFFLAIASSLLISSLFIFLDKYLETRMLKFKKFVDEYTLIIHKRFYSKEYDIEN